MDDILYGPFSRSATFMYVCTFTDVMDAISHLLALDTILRSRGRQTVRLGHCSFSTTRTLPGLTHQFTTILCLPVARLLVALVPRTRV